ncbi:MAG: hypothetical protein KKA10_16825 [Euryarchaeota archaeon]|nr:hypothetical protein [Euryarchaeota archaeon]
MTTQPISKDQLDILRKLGMPEVKENNQWLVLHVKGDGIRALESWNAMVYTNDAGNMKVVTTDMTTLVALLSGQPQAPKRVSSEPGRVISIDDSGWGCETDDAEVLTKRGWLSCYNLKKDDYVLSYRDDGVIRWSPILNIEVHPFDGRINQFKHRRISIRVTPDHHMKVLKRVFKGNAIKHTSKLVGFRTEYVHVSDLKNNDRVPQTGRWVGTDTEYFILPGIEQIKHDSFSRDPVKIRMDDWLAFFGLWLSEGGIVKVANKQGNGAAYRVHLYQNTKTETAERIREVLRRLPFRSSEMYRRKVGFGIENEQSMFSIFDKQLYTYLKQFGKAYDKHIPRDILDLPPERLRVLIQYMSYGDGNLCYSHNGKSVHQRYYTSSPKLRDGLQEIIVKTGRGFSTRIKNNKKCVRDNFDISINNTKWCVVGNMEYTSPYYKGNVFDLSVLEDRSFLVRREGKSYFTGNCPMLGTLVGLHDSLTGRIVFDDVPVKYYQSPLFEKKTYLHVAAASALALAMREFRLYEYNMDDILFKICTGYVNKGIVDSLKESGFKVETCAIGEPLQSALEKAHAEYIQKMVGSASLYYDPKELTDDNIRKAYSNTMK